ncbi:MAG: LytTR family transcriptional regulator DNA-binding domain-containing protein [Anaerolineales bacterium]|jgi:ABC-2 type transport system ATP-binding protein
MNPMLIEIKNLKKSVDQKNVLDILEFGVSSGEVSAIIGTADSGKEVLIDLLLGKTRPNMGEVRVAGIDPFAEGEVFSQKVGVLFAEDNLYIRQSAISNLEFYGRLHRLPRGRASEVLEMVGLADNANTRVEDLSPSLKRRLSFARAILHQPEVLLLTEPFRNCDANTIAILSKQILTRAKKNAAVLVISETNTHLTKICTKVYRLEDGRISEAGTEEDHSQTLPFMIPAKLEGRVALINPSDILYALAQDNKAYLQTTTDLYPTQFTLSELEKRLSRSGFFRAHRSYLVNLQHVKEVIPYTRDSYSLRLKDPASSKIPLSKSAARELRELLGF